MCTLLMLYRALANETEVLKDINDKKAAQQKSPFNSSHSRSSDSFTAVHRDFALLFMFVQLR